MQDERRQDTPAALWRAAVLVAGLVLVGCSQPGERAGLRARVLALAEPGPWHIPPATLAIGDLQYVPYTGAGPWPGQGCSGAVTPQAEALRDELLARFDQIDSVGDYACRHIYGDSARMSVHGVGRALDLHVATTDSGEADNDLGDPIANWLVENARAWQVQYLIWDGWQWNASRPPGAKDGAYGGAHPHHDHLHVEVAAAGSIVDPAGAAADVVLEPATERRPARLAVLVLAGAGLWRRRAGCSG